MGYLRGTKGTSNTVVVRTSRPKTVKEEIRALKRKVALYRNAPHFHSVRSTLNSAGAGSWSQFELDITNAFVTSSTYHDNVTGDEYLNNSLQTKIDVGQDVAKCRMIVYVPKNPLVKFIPSNDQAGHITQPDPNSFWILKDVYINHNTDVFNTATTYWCNLRKMRTVFNTDSDIVEKGRVWIYVHYLNTATASGNGTIWLSNQLSITDR